MSHGAMVMERPKVEYTLTVKLDRDVVESARIVAAIRNERISDMLSAILRPIVAKMEKAEIAKRTKGGE